MTSRIPAASCCALLLAQACAAPPATDCVEAEAAERMDAPPAAVARSAASTIELPDLCAPTDAGPPPGPCEGPVCLDDLARVAECEEIAGDVVLKSDFPVPRISLPRLRRVQGSVEIRLVGLSSLELPALASVAGELVIFGSQLVDLSGLAALEAVEGRVRILDNARLTTLSSLSRLTSAPCGVEIHDDDLLVDIAGLEGVQDAASCTLGVGAVTIRRNRALSSLAGLSGLRRTELISIEENPALIALSGLDGLEEATHVHLEENDALVDLTALGGARSPRPSSLSVRENGSLEVLDGLEGAVELSSLAVAGNRSLRSIAALDGLLRVHDLVAVRNNPRLPTCEVDRLVARTTGPGFRGAVEVGGNACEGACP